VYCQFCGTNTDALTCPSCGRDAPASPTVGSRPASSKQDSPQGVEGWLLFLCVSLTIVAPLFDLKIGIKALTNMITSRSLTLFTASRLASVAAVYLGLALYSFMAGLRLWLLKPNAPHFARIFLILSTTTVITLYTILYAAGVHVDILRIVFGRSVFLVVWYSYLQTSRRVKATYPQGADQPF
jgi:hypothetical protein